MRVIPVTPLASMADIDWLEWNGVRSTDYGLVVLSQPSIVRPQERATPQEVPGFSGSLTYLQGENVFQPLSLSAVCVMDSPYVHVEDTTLTRIEAVSRWLRGYGTVKFANRPYGFYKASIINQIGFDTIVRGNPHMSFQVPFTCHPFFYWDEGMIEITLLDNTETLNNPGNIPAEPLLIVEGTGDGAIMCGRSTLLLEDLGSTPYVKIDCEILTAYRGERGNPLDPLIPLNHLVIDANEKFTIPNDSSIISFSGDITSLKIMPRWRSV